MPTPQETFICSEDAGCAREQIRNWFRAKRVPNGQWDYRTEGSLDCANLPFWRAERPSFSQCTAKTLYTSAPTTPAK